LPPALGLHTRPDRILRNPGLDPGAFVPPPHGPRPPADEKGIPAGKSNARVPYGNGFSPRMLPGGS
jgi:hypothetical protein